MENTSLGYSRLAFADGQQDGAQTYASEANAFAWMKPNECLQSSNAMWNAGTQQKMLNILFKLRLKGKWT